MFDLLVNYDLSTVTIMEDLYPGSELTLDLERFKAELEKVR